MATPKNITFREADKKILRGLARDIGILAQDEFRLIWDIRSFVYTSHAQPFIDALEHKSTASEATSSASIVRKNAQQKLNDAQQLGIRVAISLADIILAYIGESPTTDAATRQAMLEQFKSGKSHFERKDGKGRAASDKAIQHIGNVWTLIQHHLNSVITEETGRPLELPDDSDHKDPRTAIAYDGFSFPQLIGVAYVHYTAEELILRAISKLDGETEASTKAAVHAFRQDFLSFVQRSFQAPERHNPDISTAPTGSQLN